MPRLTLLVVCIAGCLIAQPSPTNKRAPGDNGVGSKNGAQNSTTEKEQTEKSPSTSQTQPTSSSTKNADKVSPRQPPSQVTADPIVLYTKWLAIFAGLQLGTFIAQGIIFFFTLRATKTSADAAMLSATALIDIERPWVVITKIDAPVLQVRNGYVAPLGFAFELSNRGRTAAKVSGVWARFHTVQSIINMPVPPDYRDMGLEDGPVTVLLPDSPQFRLSRLLDEVSLTEDQVTAIRAKRLYWCFYGLVRYIDVANRLHELQFCYVYFVPASNDPMPIPEGWKRGGPKEYNCHT